MKTYYIKAKTGFREDQFVTIPMQEAHKAYYLFLNPEERGLFSNGVGLIGKNIQEIQPDWNATMGWNQAHQLNADDFNELNRLGVNEKMKYLIMAAKDASDFCISNYKLLKLPMKDVLQQMKYPTKLDMIPSLQTSITK